MLFTLGLLFLLTSLASSETTTSEKRDGAERNTTKIHEVLNSSKPKIPALASTQTFHPTLKPNPVNQTVLPTSATKLKVQPVNTTEAGKSRPRPTDAPSVAAKIPKTNKGKHLANQTVSDELTRDAKGRKGKLSSNGTPNVQSTSVKSPLARIAKLSTHKPKSVNHTVPTVSNHRKISEGEATQNASSSSVKSHSVRMDKIIKNKPKQTVNHTISNVPILSSHSKTAKNKTIPNVPSVSKKSPSTHTAKAVTHRPLPSLNQTDVNESHSSHNRKAKEEESAQNVSSKATKSPLVHITKPIKNKPLQPTNHTTTIESATTGHSKAVKNETFQNAPSASTSSPLTSSGKSTKNKPQQSDNPTISNKFSHRGKTEGNSTQTIQSTKTNTIDGPKITKGINQTVSTIPLVNATKPPIKDGKGLKVATLNKTSIEVHNKKQPTASQPVTVVICNGCDSNNNKDQEVKLSPGNPLVVTHKISLQPGGCPDGHEAKLDALKDRVARLEKEMSFLKEQCTYFSPCFPIIFNLTHCPPDFYFAFFLHPGPCSTKCPNGCSGNGRCEKGSCICQQGFMGADCSKCKQGAGCNTSK